MPMAHIGSAIYAGASEQGERGTVMRAFGLDDGSVLVVDGVEAPLPSTPKPGRDGTLSRPDEVAAWVGDVVAAGVTFDVLKETARRIARRAVGVDHVAASAETV